MKMKWQKSLTILMGLGICGGAANAGITLSGIANQNLPSKTTNGYRVSVFASKVGGQFQFRVYQVTANWDGHRPVSDADTLVVKFTNGPRNVSGMGCTGATVGGIVIAGAAHTFGVAPGGTGGAWTSTGGANATFTNGGFVSAVQEARELDKSSNNMFAQDPASRILVSLAAKCFTVQLQNFTHDAEDGNNYRYGDLAFNIPDLNGVPEGSSAAMIGLGALPLGLLIRRRKTNKS